MSKKNNVNPDHYKVGGRDRVNEGVVGGKGAPRTVRPARRRRARQPLTPRKSKTSK